jgi:hypothetical protein
MKLLSKGNTNAKTSKNELTTFIMYLAPHTQNSKGINICPNASEGCAKGCLFTAGRGSFSSVINARTNKTEFLLNDIKEFYLQLAREIRNKVKYYDRKREKIAFRLNGTSDLDHVQNLKRYACLDISELKNSAIFYDYTKSITRVQKYVGHVNYHLTFSQDETPQSKINSFTALNLGVNVAVVFNELPESYINAEVINGDKTDFRPNDKKGVVVGLIAKGRARKDNTGFVIK